MQVTMLPFFFFCFFVSPSCKSKKHPELWFKLPFGGDYMNMHQVSGNFISKCRFAREHLHTLPGCLTTVNTHAAGKRRSSGNLPAVPGCAWLSGTQAPASQSCSVI